MNEASEAVLVSDERGALIFFNEAARQFFGFDAREADQQSVHKIFESDVHPTLARFFSGAASAAPQRTLTENTRAILQNGVEWPVSLLLSRVSRQETKLFMLVVEELLPTDNYPAFEQVARRITHALSVYNGDLQCVFANQAVTQLGADSAPTYQKSGGFLTSILEEEQPAVRQSLNEAIEARQERSTIAYHAQFAGGQRAFIINQVHFVYQADGPLAYLIAREEKQTAAAADELFILTNPDLTIDYISNSCFVHLGYTPREVMQKYTLRDLLYSKDWAKLLTLAENSSTVSVTMVLPLKHHSDKQLVAQARINPFFNNQNQLTYTAIRLTDIVDQAATEAQGESADASAPGVEALVRAKEAAEQAMRSREEFISTMSHEIRTPLNAISGIADLLLANDGATDQRKLIQTLKFSSDNLSALVNDILSHSKLAAGTVTFNAKPFNLTSFVQGIKLTYQNLVNSRGVKFRLLLEDNFPETVVGDVNRLGQILNNLLNNAIKFTTEGQIVLGGYVEDLAKDQCTLLFEVADSGIGIAADQLDRVFEPYQQAGDDTASRYGGTGLGLSIVKSLVERQGGKITVDSQPGAGTTFRVRLPFALPNPDEPNAAPSLSDYASLGGLRVLYVEDTIPNQLLMEGFANRWDVSLDTALDGLIALEKIKQRQYDVILMDIQMPHMDGFEATQQIRNLSDPHYRDVPIIALSASVSEETQHRIQQVGMNDYLPKPLDPQQLHTKLQALVPATSSSELGGSYLVRTETVDAPDFSQLYELYSDDEEGYRLILAQIKLLSSESQPQILEAIRRQDPEPLRFTVHKIMSHVRMLKLDRFEELLRQTKQQVKENPGMALQEELIERIRFHFDNIMATITREIEAHTP